MTSAGMPPEVMAEALHAAGFGGVEIVADETSHLPGGKGAGPVTIHARLSAGSLEFTARPQGDGWVMAIQWPLRATEAQMAGFAATHPGSLLDIWNGETRLRLILPPGDSPDLHRWAALAESFVASAVRWRRLQRAPGEGM